MTLDLKIMNQLPAADGFLALPDETDYQTAKYVIQQVPYEHTSSYLEGSAKGPAAIVSASHFVEFYDEELDAESYRNRITIIFILTLQ